jgi:hypothetical protein
MRRLERLPYFCPIDEVSHDDVSHDRLAGLLDVAELAINFLALSQLFPFVAI